MVPLSQLESQLRVSHLSDMVTIDGLGVHRLHDPMAAHLLMNDELQSTADPLTTNDRLIHHPTTMH